MAEDSAVTLATEPPQVDTTSLLTQLQALLPEKQAEAIASWEIKNKMQLDALALWRKQKSQALERAPSPLFMITEVDVPEDALPEMEALLVGGATLHNGYATVFNSLRQRPSAERETALQDWQKQNQAVFAQQALLAQNFSDQAEDQPLPTLPPEPSLPPQASAEVQQRLRRQYVVLKKYWAGEQQVRRLPRAQRAAARQLVLQRIAIEAQSVNSATP